MYKPLILRPPAGCQGFGGNGRSEGVTFFRNVPSWGQVLKIPWKSASNDWFLAGGLEQ